MVGGDSRTYQAIWSSLWEVSAFGAILLMHMGSVEILPYGILQLLHRLLGFCYPKRTEQMILLFD